MIVVYETSTKNIKIVSSTDNITLNIPENCQSCTLPNDSSVPDDFYNYRINLDTIPPSFIRKNMGIVELVCAAELNDGRYEFTAGATATLQLNFKNEDGSPRSVTDTITLTPTRGGITPARKVNLNNQSTLVFSWIFPSEMVDPDLNISFLDKEAWVFPTQCIMRVRLL